MFALGEGAEGFAVAVVGFVLADDYEVDGLFEVGEGGDVWFVGVFGVLEGRVEDGAAARQPRIYEDGECAGESMRVFFCCFVGW